LTLDIRAGGVLRYPGDDGDGLENVDVIVDEARMNPFYLETPEASGAVWPFNGLRSGASVRARTGAPPSLADHRRCSDLDGSCLWRHGV
jgi:hypothetical protein